MNYKLKHHTVYAYLNAVENYQAIVCLKPQNLVYQECKNFILEIKPNPKKIITRIDYWGNTQHFFSIHTPHKELKVTATSILTILPKEILKHSTISCSETLCLLKNDIKLKNELLPYQLPSSFIEWDEEIKAFASPYFESNRSFYECIRSLNEGLFTNFKFDSRFSTINTPLKTILKEKKGVCQDFSHLMIASLRSLGFAARYVSGYIETLPPIGKPKLQGSDASHAWVSVYVPGLGWCEFDPTNNMVPQEKHIVTAYGRDYADVVPLKGIIFSSGEHTVEVEVDVIPVLY